MGERVLYVVHGPQVAIPIFDIGFLFDDLCERAYMENGAEFPVLKICIWFNVVGHLRLIKTIHLRFDGETSWEVEWNCLARFKTHFIQQTPDRHKLEPEWRSEGKLKPKRPVPKFRSEASVKRLINRRLKAEGRPSAMVKRKEDIE